MDIKALEGIRYVNFQGNQPMLLNFGCMEEGGRVYDIAVSLWNHSLVNENFIEREQWKRRN